MRAAPDDGPTLVLVSGTLATEGLWDPVLAHLTAHHRRVVRRSDVADSVRGTAAALLREVDGPLAVAGHSFGGIVATEMLRQAPDRVERIALLSASARAASPDQRRTWAAWCERVEAGGLRDLAEDVTTASLGDVADTDVHRRAVALGVEAGPDGLLRQLTAQDGRPDGHAVLAGATVPVLAVAGGADRVCPPSLTAEAVAACPHAEVVVLPGVGHLTPLETPAEVARALDAWLERSASSAVSLVPTRTSHPEGDQ